MLAFSTSISLFNPDTLVNLCAALFIIPYFLFSPLAGQLADKFEKSCLIRFIKLAEVCLITLAILSLYLNSLFLLLTSLFLLGTQATFFGPVKYSILPQHLQTSELIAGNGLIEMGTFIAILLGTMLGGILIALPHSGLLWLSITMAMAAMIGLLSSFFIPTAKAYAPDLKLNGSLFKGAAEIIQTAYQNRIVFYSIIGISWFWMYGSMFLTQTGNYTRLVLGGTEQVATLLLIVFSVGIGTGSVLCDKISHKKIEMGVVPFGCIGLTLFAFDFSFANSSLPPTILNAQQFLVYGQNWRILLDGFLMGTFGGFYLVPLYALIQHHSLPEQRSRVIAANNIINAIFMTMASVIAILCLNLGFTIPHLFLLTAILNIVVGVYIFRCVPEFFTRFLIWGHLRKEAQ